MKSTTQSYNDRGEIGDGAFGLRSRPCFPATDCHFQTDRLGGSGVRQPGAELRAFRDLSRDFLRQESRRNYIKETVLFGVLAAVSAWPIATMISALVKMLR